MRLTSAEVAILESIKSTYDQVCSICFFLMKVSNGTKLCHDLQIITSVRLERATLDFWEYIFFVTINLLIREGTCVIFLKTPSAAICSNQFWVRPMQSLNVHLQNIQNENNKSMLGCWRLWRDPQARWDWVRQTEALRHGLRLMLLQDTLYEIKIRGASVLCAKTRAQEEALSSGFLYASGSPLHSSAKEDPHQCECWTKGTFSLQRTAFTGNSVGAKGEKCRTPSKPQVSLEISAASSQGFLFHWRTAIKTTHYFDSIHVRIKPTIAQGCLFLSFSGKLE